MQVAHAESWTLLDQRLKEEEQAKLSLQQQESDTARDNGSWLQFREMSDNQRKREQEFENLKRLKEEENVKKREMELQQMRERSASQQSQQQQQQQSQRSSPPYAHDTAGGHQMPLEEEDEIADTPNEIEVNTYGSFASSSGGFSSSL